MWDRAEHFFSPPGRRWPEGSDEGATPPYIAALAPSSRCRGLLPGGEKKQAATARTITKRLGGGVHNFEVIKPGKFVAN